MSLCYYFAYIRNRILKSGVCHNSATMPYMDKGRGKPAAAAAEPHASEGSELLLLLLLLLSDELITAKAGSERTFRLALSNLWEIFAIDVAESWTLHMSPSVRGAFPRRPMKAFAQPKDTVETALCWLRSGRCGRCDTA
jgi:hypothetical protein